MAGSQIGDRLKAARGKMTQVEAARRARELAKSRGVQLRLHSQTLSDYERGEIAKVPSTVLDILSDVYGVVLIPLAAARQELSQTAKVGASPSSDREIERIVDQVRNVAARLNHRRTQGADSREILRLSDELRFHVRNSIRATSSDEDSIELVVDSLVELLISDSAPSRDTRIPPPQSRSPLKSEKHG
jgi:transcriptional regulator with XRE-family HTH domain